MRSLKIGKLQLQQTEEVTYLLLLLRLRFVQELRKDNGWSCPISLGVTANVAITRIKRNIYMPPAAEATQSKKSSSSNSTLD